MSRGGPAPFLSCYGDEVSDDGRCAGHIYGVRCAGPSSHQGPCALKYEDVDQLRRDRDELVAALEEMLDEHDADVGKCCAPGCRAKRALIARIKGGG